MTKSTKDLSKEDALKGIARERQLMIDPTVAMIYAINGNSQKELFEVQTNHDLE